MTEGAHLRQAAKTFGVTPTVLTATAERRELPGLLAHVWGWFLELCATRGDGFSVVPPVTFSEIDAWSRLTGTRPEPREVRLLRALDELYISVMTPGTKKKKTEGR